MSTPGCRHHWLLKAVSESGFYPGHCELCGADAGKRFPLYPKNRAQSPTEQRAINRERKVGSSFLRERAGAIETGF